MRQSKLIVRRVKLISDIQLQVVTIMYNFPFQHFIFGLLYGLIAYI